MTAAALPIAVPAIRRPFNPAHEFFRREPLLASLGLLMAALLLPTAFAMFVDQRTLAGVNVWVKPLKFEASLALYTLTLAWLAAWLPAGTRARPWYRTYIRLVAAAIVLEMAWLLYAAAIGQPSHFNRTDPVLALVYPVMGGMAVVLTSATLVYGLQIRRNDALAVPPALKAAVVQGLVVTFVLTVLAAGFMSTGGSHLVGGNVSDVEALPVMGWARDGGDLRVAHFFATHAMHFIPAFGFAWAMVAGGKSTRPVNLFTVLFAAFTLFLILQALDGRPFLPAIG
ncbi:MAG: hypothetical protein K5872_12015 [Rhizobiaceae bacterium]|nr:hypothetical protein [Rhizobiaceae bacterium]MCV0406941.1 hypothetical protein [Rhizobiaceae bacterium]